MADVRPMTPADFGQVAALANDAASCGLLALPAWETEADVTADMARLDRAEFLVATDKEEPSLVVGFAGYSLHHSGEAHMYGPVVKDQGHGTGAYLMSRVESLATQAGAHSFAMFIGLSNRSGAAWAEWRGYQRDLETPEMLHMWASPGTLQTARAYEGGVVRNAVAADLPVIYEVYQSSLPNGQQTPDEWARWLSCTTVLEENGLFLGIMRLDRQNCRIRTLAVPKANRRQGVATRLVAETLRRFWQERPTKVTHIVRLENSAGIGLMRRLGFTREIPVAKWAKREG